MQKWQITSSKTLVDDKWLKLRVNSCVTPVGGKVDTYYVLEPNDWANCVVIDADNKLIMVRHYRHPVRDFLLEFVSGGIEKDDPSPAIGIKRELEEEIGYTGDEIYQTGVSYPNPGLQTNKVYSFLAIGGTCSQEPQLEAGESLSVEKIPLLELIESIENPKPGIIYQAMHIVALHFALSFIKKSPLDSLQDIKKILADAND
jgi:8-oxo-dGTP pyrophosphatase MutT (NUDIX family)